MQFLQLRRIFHITKLCLEFLGIIKLVRVEEIQQRPQLLRVVLIITLISQLKYLKRSTREEQLAAKVNLPQHIA